MIGERARYKLSSLVSILAALQTSSTQPAWRGQIKDEHGF